MGEQEGRYKGMTTAYHSQYWAHALTLRGATGTIEDLSRSIAGARVVKTIFLFRWRLG